MGAIQGVDGNYAEARVNYEESLKIRRDISDPRSLASSLFGLGWLANLRQDHAAARIYLKESLEINYQLRNKYGIADTLVEYGLAHLEEQLPDAARRYLYEALQTSQEIGAKSIMVQGLLVFGRLFLVQNQLEYSAELLGLAMRHPALTKVTRLTYAAYLHNELEERLSPPQLKASMAQGTMMDLNTVVESILKI